jgi:hypothetical protein
VLRLLPALLAVYELRYLIAHLTAFAMAPHGAGSGQLTLWAFVLLGAGSVWLVRESGRGLGLAVPRPGWSLRFVRSWMACSAGLAALLLAANLLHAPLAIGHAQPLAHSLAAGGWPAVPVVLLIGLVLAASLHGAHWFLLELGRVRQRPCELHASSLLLLSGSAEHRSAAAPLRAGWSGRGPPPAAVPAAI